MNGKSKVMAFTRDPMTRGLATPYESKFADWIKIIAQANGTDVEAIVISDPWVIGDTYEEIVESLSWLGGTNLALLIADRKSTVEDN
jgi:hypothetical protein